MLRGLSSHKKSYNFQILWLLCINDFFPFILICFFLTFFLICVENFFFLNTKCHFIVFNSWKNISIFCFFNPFQYMVPFYIFPKNIFGGEIEREQLLKWVKTVYFIRLVLEFIFTKRFYLVALENSLLIFVLDVIGIITF